LRLEQST